MQTMIPTLFIKQGYNAIPSLQTKIVDTESYLLDVIPGFKLLQQEHCLLGLLVTLNFVFNHQWDLWDFLNTVS